MLRSLALVAAAPLCAQWSVVSIEPARLTPLGAAQGVTVTFAQPVQAASVHAQSLRAFGRFSGPTPGTVAVAAGGMSATFTPLRPWFPGENVTFTLTQNVLAANGSTRTGGYWWTYRTAAAPGSRSFALAQTIPLRSANGQPIGTYGIHAADLDGDGAPDLIAMNEFGNDLRVLHNSGCGSYGPMTVHPDPGQWPSPSASADFDGDGRIDLATGNQYGGTVSVHRNDGQGGLLAPLVLTVGGYVHGIAAADFDGDGRTDLAATTQSDVCVLRNLGAGAFAVIGRYDVGSGEDSLCALDADGDGHADLAVGCRDTNLVLLRGLGDGNFTAGPPYPTGGIPFHATTGDLDRDGNADVVVALRAANACAVLRGNGSGGFAAPLLYPAGQHPAAVEVGDLDGDGAPDAVVANYSSGSFSVFWNRGDGVLLAGPTLPAATSGSCSTMVDFDRDGLLDLIGADETADEARLFRQLPATSSAVQAGGCALRVRVDQQGYGAGFGGLPPQPVRANGRLALGLSGSELGLAALGVGVPLAAPQPLPGMGWLHLDPQAALTLLLAPLDAHGEWSTVVQLPGPAALGWQFAVQGALLAPTSVAANPQACVLTR